MKSDMENKEWADEEMSLKQVTKNNPFTVPVSYFEQAGQRILSLIAIEEFNTNNPAQGFTVPANYFDNLSADIQSRINIEAAVEKEQPGFAVPQGYFEQLNSNIQSRVKLEAVNANEQSFAVPEGYFEQLTNNIQSRINLEAAAKADETSFSVPAGYFENLQSQIAARIAVEEAFEAGKPEFTVPDDYFEQLNKSILNKTVNQDMVIRKTIVRKLWASNTFKYATAACLTLIIGAGVFLRQAAAPVTHTHTYLHTELSGVPVNEIEDYLDLRAEGSDPLIENDKQINTDALDANLQDYIELNQ
ncbi:hypothetical protein [Mucilaginibacter glaciei]|uniref:Uncharacterized protein n=1 Tax=Mucilaginibacter glaciei TaxID=2772109 RepID=A0A926NQY9_9SPHI|nr:hypothetical protein [Mucilaginibacter glaciei]MBD1393095.1 hypothetical protein [Mucilaginibacter glaciei]